MDATIAPATRWNPTLNPGQPSPARDAFVRSSTATLPLPASDADIAFAPVTQLSRWIQQKAISSERLTNIYLTRIEQFDSKLRCIITLMRDAALAQARRADAGTDPSAGGARHQLAASAARPRNRPGPAAPAGTGTVQPAPGHARSAASPHPHN